MSRSRLPRCEAATVAGECRATQLTPEIMSKLYRIKSRVGEREYVDWYDAPSPAEARAKWQADTVRYVPSTVTLEVVTCDEMDRKTLTVAEALGVAP